MTSLVAQRVRSLACNVGDPALDWEDPLEKEMATRSIIHAWEIPWTEDTGGLQYMGCKRVGHNLATKTTNSNKRG